MYPAKVFENETSSIGDIYSDLKMGDVNNNNNKKGKLMLVHFYFISSLKIGNVGHIVENWWRQQILKSCVRQ